MLNCLLYLCIGYFAGFVTECSFISVYFSFFKATNDELNKILGRCSSTYLISYNPLPKVHTCDV